MLVLLLHILQGESCLWQGVAAHSDEFGCKYLTMISTPSHLESATICFSVFPTQQHPTQKSAGPKRRRSLNNRTSPPPKHMLVLSLRILQGEFCLWQGGAAHSGEFGCNNYTVISGVKSKTCCRRWRWHDFLHRLRFYATDFYEYNEFTLNVVMTKMEIIPPIGDTRYESFLDKSKKASPAEKINNFLFPGGFWIHKMGKKSKSKTPREMQDNIVAVEEEKTSSSAKKLLN
ncbi:unnamed protein product, partial [Prunus brigantina]